MIIGAEGEETDSGQEATRRNGAVFGRLALGRVLVDGDGRGGRQVSKFSRVCQVFRNYLRMSRVLSTRDGKAEIPRPVHFKTECERRARPRRDERQVCVERH